MLAKLFFVLGLLTLISGVAFAQPAGVGVELSPVPIWPKSGNIPNEFQDSYVFLDPEAGQMVLAYPENLGSEDFQGAPGAMRIKRIDLGNQVAASISVAVERRGSEFEYRYRVSNHNQARHSVQQLQVAVPMSSPDIAPVRGFWLAILSQIRTCSRSSRSNYCFGREHESGAKYLSQNPRTGPMSGLVNTASVLSLPRIG